MRLFRWLVSVTLATIFFLGFLIDTRTLSPTFKMALLSARENSQPTVLVPFNLNSPSEYSVIRIENINTIDIALCNS